MYRLLYRLLPRILCVVALGLSIGFCASAATISPSLSSALPNLPDSAGVGIIIVAFDTSSGLRSSDLDLLRGVGITTGITYQQLGMVGAPATAGQVRSLAQNPAVRSVWSNDSLTYYNNQPASFAGSTGHGMIRRSSG